MPPLLVNGPGRAGRRGDDPGGSPVAAQHRSLGDLHTVPGRLQVALYVAGRVPGQWSVLQKAQQDKIVADLTQYQKVAELIVGLIETTLRMNRLAKQNTMIRQAWHRELWPFMDDPVKLEAILQPQEKELTILFCDLRNYSLFASQHKADLLPAWKNIASALEIMAATITDLGGVVGGFRGDAVLGFWGWPDSREKQVERAGRAAVRIKDRLGGRSQGKQCGLGLTHGRALAGRLSARSRRGQPLRAGGESGIPVGGHDQSVRGGGNRRQEVATRITGTDPDGEKLRCRKLGNVRAKGFPEPVPAYELFSTDSPSVSDWQRMEWDALVELFTEGRWTEAYDGFSQQFPEDTAAQCFMRVMNATDLIPPRQWDGSFVPPGPQDG